MPPSSPTRSRAPAPPPRRTSNALRRITAHTTLIAALLPIAAFTTTTATAPSAQAANAEADDLFKKGNAFYKAKKWQDAYDAYKKAYKLEPRYDIAGNLGDVSLTLGKHREAAEYLSHALRTMPAAKADMKAKVQARLEQAKKEIGTLSITVNVEGAQVTCDERDVGTAPLGGEVFVEAGATTVVVRAEGHEEAQRTVALNKGQTKQVEIILKADPNAVVAPPPGAGGAGAGGASGGVAEANGGTSVSSDGMSTKPILLIGGGALAAVGLGVFVGFTIAKGSAKDDADTLRGETTQTFGEGRCPPGVQACEDLKDANARGRRAETWSTIGLVGAGVGIAAMATGLLWPDKKKQTSASSIRVGGSAGPSSVRLSLEGAF